MSKPNRRSESPGRVIRHPSSFLKILCVLGLFASVLNSQAWATPPFVAKLFSPKAPPVPAVSLSGARDAFAGYLRNHRFDEASKLAMQQKEANKDRKIKEYWTQMIDHAQAKKLEAERAVQK